MSFLRRYWQSQTAMYASMSLVSQGIALLLRLIVNNVLGPAAVGMLTYVDLMKSYAMSITTPFRSVVDMEMPLLRGRGETLLEGKLVSQSLIVGTLVNVCISGVVCLLAVASKDGDLRSALYLFSVSNIFFQIYSFYQIILRNSLLFRALSIINIGYSLFVGCLGYYGAARGGVVGYLLLQGGGTALFALTVIRICGFKIRWSLDGDVLKLILAKGGWLGLGGVLYGIFIEIDRLVVVRCFSNAEVGYYSLVFLVTANFMVLVNALNATFIPTFLHGFGNDGDLAVLRKIFISRIVQTQYVLLPIVISCYLLLPAAVVMVLPEFIRGVECTQESLFRVMCLSLVPLTATVFSACQKYRHFFWLALNHTIASAGIISLAVIYRRDLVIAAWSMNVCILMFCIAGFALACRCLSFSWPFIARFSLMFCASLAAVFWGLHFAEEFLAGWSGSPMKALLFRSMVISVSLLTCFAFWKCTYGRFMAAISGHE